MVGRLALDQVVKVRILAPQPDELAFARRPSVYTSDVLERASARLLPLVGRAADAAPMTTVCCNACRACATTNLVAVVLAAGAYVAGPFIRFAGRNPGSRRDLRRQPSGP